MFSQWDYTQVSKEEVVKVYDPAPCIILLAYTYDEILHCP